MLRILLALSLFAATQALACGSFFPEQLLLERRQVLLSKHYYPLADSLPKVAREIPALPLATHSVEAYEKARFGDELGERMDRYRHAETADIAVLLALPPPAQAYVKGARHYWQGESDLAMAEFQAALAADPTDDYALWARHMIATITLRNEDHESALPMFVAIADKVLAGRPDPLGLAAFGLGERARIHIDYRDDLLKGLELYAQQSALGEPGANDSISAIFRFYIKEEADYLRLLDSDLGQRLLLAQALFHAHFQDLLIGGKPFSQLLFERVEPGKLDSPQLDQLIGVAYQTGRYEDAERLVQMSDSGVAWWHRAKLALRRDDRKSAASAYDRAVERISSRPEQIFTDPWDQSTATARTRVRGEAAVLAVSEGEFVKAADLFVQATAGIDWGGEPGHLRYRVDLAYVAERLLTIDELTALIERSADWAEIPQGAIDDLKGIAGRRMVRKGRFDQAKAFLPPELHAKLASLQRAMATTKTETGIAVGRAWFEAGSLWRWSGLTLVGFETGPDWAMSGGNDTIWEDESDEDSDPWKTEAEACRFESTAPRNPNRWHYRFEAANYAERAASFLPPGSQPHAAVLCQATYWRNGGLDDSAYAKYRAAGVVHSFDQVFGTRHCPQPDWDSLDG